MVEPIEYGPAEPCVGEDLGHFKGAMLVVTMMVVFSLLGDHFEKRFGSDFGKRDIAEFIDNRNLHGTSVPASSSILFPLRFNELLD